MRWLLTGDEFSAAEAPRMGLVQKVTPVGEASTYNRAITLLKPLPHQALLGVYAIPTRHDCPAVKSRKRLRLPAAGVA